VATGFTHGVEQKLAQLSGELRQQFLIQGTQIGRALYAIEQGRLRAVVWNFCQQTCFALNGLSVVQSKTAILTGLGMNNYNQA